MGKKLKDQYDNEVNKKETDKVIEKGYEEKKGKVEEKIDARVLDIKEKGQKKTKAKKSKIYQNLFVEHDEDFFVIFSALNMIISKTKYKHWEFTKDEIEALSPELNYVLGYHFGSFTLYAHHLALLALVATYITSRTIFGQIEAMVSSDTVEKGVENGIKK